MSETCKKVNDDDEYHEKYEKNNNIIENPVVNETEDVTDEDLDWLMDSVVCVRPAVAEPAEVHLEEEVRQYNIESEDLQFENNIEDDDDFFNLTVIDDELLPPPMPEKLFEHSVLDAVPQIPDWMPEKLSDQYLLIALLLNALMIRMASEDPDMEFMEDTIIDHLICKIGTDSDFDKQLDYLTPDEDN
ncbi:unnamed protein product [Macrosiphum euphorbiae]|uniref:Uncharacterized protein n=1 Tax=Macrosiphum euphorbiae TaxID=13131 RepID=A0AAV0W2U2_9HEMI|nr:unnamed protein product [Macrosiphum euphorbiae]